MTTRLSKASIQRAIEHIATFGDTDVFPHPIETTFLIEKKNEIAAELSVLDLDNFEPAQALKRLPLRAAGVFALFINCPC